MVKFIKHLILTLIFLLVVFPNDIVAQDATGEGESVLQKIKEKVEAIRSSPKAFVGSVTDKTENSLQVTDIGGKIQQISIKEEIAIVKVGKTNTDIKYTDVAIGDYIVAMGILEGNVLDAKRILLTTPIEEPKRAIVFGTISKIQNKDITITDKKGTENTFTFPKRWNGPEIKDLEAGNTVLVVYVNEEGKLNVRTIQEINVNPSPTPQLSPKPTGSE